MNQKLKVREANIESPINLFNRELDQELQQLPLKAEIRRRQQTFIFRKVKHKMPVSQPSLRGTLISWLEMYHPSPGKVLREKVIIQRKVIPTDLLMISQPRVLSIDRVLKMTKWHHLSLQRIPRPPHQKSHQVSLMEGDRDQIQMLGRMEWRMVLSK